MITPCVYVPQVDFRPFVYGLVDPLEPKHIRYVGMARQPKRPFAHSKDARRLATRRSHKINWLRQLQAEGREPVVMVLEELSENASTMLLGFVESCYIKSLREIGHELTNLTDGGEGLINPTQDVRDQIAQSQTAAMADPAVRKQISEKQKARLASPEAREVCARSGRLAVLSSDGKERIARKSRERWEDSEYREAHISDMKSTMSTPEWHKAQSDRIRESWEKNPERRKRFASPEARAKHSATMKSFYAKRKEQG